MNRGWGDGTHPQEFDSIMNLATFEDERDFAEPDCAPYPFDLMAIYALYQSR